MTDGQAGGPSAILTGATLWIDGSFRDGLSIVVQDGQISAVVRDSAEPSTTGLQHIRLDGATVVPGFVDAHNHPLSWSRGRGKVDLSEARSIDDVLTTLRHALVDPGHAGDWLEAVGIGEGRNLQDGRLPNRTELDAVSQDRPIFVAGGTLAAVNSVGLLRAGLDDVGEDVPGGRVEHDATGRPSGILLGRGAIDSVRRQIPRPSASDERAWLREFLTDLAAMGVTAVTDYASVDHHTSFSEDFAVYAAIRESLPVRCRVAYRLNVDVAVGDELESLQAFDPTDFGPDAMLGVGPLKAFCDGGVLGAHLRDDYEGRPGYRGLELVSREDIERLSRFALSRDWQLSLHALGGGAIDNVLTVWGRLGSAEVKRCRFSIQHAFDPSPENIATASELGVVIGLHQSLFYMYAPQMLDAWRGVVSPRFNPARSWLDAGVQLAGGSDIAPHDPVLALWSLTTRTTETGEVVGPEERVSTQEALGILTTGAAYGMREESSFGSIAKGLRADLAVLDRSPSTVSGDELRELRVVATLVDGKPSFIEQEIDGPWTQLESLATELTG